MSKMEVDALHSAAVLKEKKSAVKTGNSTSTSRHRISKSHCDERNRKDKTNRSIESRDQNKLEAKILIDKSENNKVLPGKEAKLSLKEEIFELEKRLQDQFVERRVLEKALANKSDAINSTEVSSLPKLTKELIREIATMELEVKHLEQYLLTLYRKAFDQKISKSSAPSNETMKQTSVAKPKQLREEQKSDISFEGRDNLDNSGHHNLCERLSDCSADISSAICPRKLTDPGPQRSHSTVSCKTGCSGKISQSEDSLSRAPDSAHSQPLLSLEEGQYPSAGGVVSLAEYLGTNIADHVPETPNKLSEELVRCMASIYCKLADPLNRRCSSSSPTSSFSSISAFSTQFLADTSPGHQKESTLDARLMNQFCVESLKEFSGPYNTMVEIRSICRDRQRLSDVEHLLRNYKLVLHGLAAVDLRRINNEEKIAFWINVHNALVMHAYIEHGVPPNNLKRASLLLKAKCRISGRLINAAMIQELILGCHTYCPGQWLRSLLYPRIRGMVGNEWQAFAIEQPEPLLHFALSSGSHSDPAVRVYTPKKLFHQLEVAKGEHIRAIPGIVRDEKINLPKILESYAKNMKLSSQDLLEMVQRCLPENSKLAMQRCRRGRSSKIIEWAQHDFSFRYLLCKELAYTS